MNCYEFTWGYCSSQELRGCMTKWDMHSRARRIYNEGGDRVYTDWIELKCSAVLAVQEEGPGCSLMMVRETFGMLGTKRVVGGFRLYQSPQSFADAALCDLRGGALGLTWQRGWGLSLTWQRGSYSLVLEQGGTSCWNLTAAVSFRPPSQPKPY